MESFKIIENKPVHDFPRLSLLMGRPKIGKSTIMSKLSDALILATDTKGYDDIEVKALVKITSIQELNSVIKYFFSEENKIYKFLVIDEIRSLTSMYDQLIKKKEGVKYSVDIGYGRGAAYLKDDIYTLIQALKIRLTECKNKYVILVGHADDKNNEIRLDISGKNENMILGMVDSIGYIDRDIDNNSTINFKIRRGVEFGSRNKFLSGYEGILEWNNLIKLAKNENGK